MKIDWKNSKNRKLAILLMVFAVLAAGKAVMYFAWEYQPLPPGAARLPVQKTAAPVIPTEKSPSEKIADGLLIGHYRRKVSLPLNPEVEVGYAIPADPQGKPLPGAENMVFYGVANGEGNRIPCSQPWLQQLAREFQCTVFSLGIKTDLSMAEDSENYYIYQESGWFEVVFEVQHKLAQRFGLPARKLLLAGESSGGSMVQRITAAYPDRIAAAAWCGGSRYDLEHIRKDGIPRLILNSWGCPGEAASAALAKREREQGNPVLCARMPPDPSLEKWYHHTPGPEAYRMIQEYLGGMAGLLHRNGGRMPEGNADRDFFPSELFAASWKNRPQWVALPGLERVFLMQPHGPTPRRIAILFGETAGENRVLLCDALFWLSRRETIPVQVEVGNDLIAGQRAAAQILEHILNEKAWKSLPILVIGIGDAGLPGAVAALANGNPRIRKIALYGSSCDSPFQELSIVENRKRSSIPLLVCGGENEVLALPNTEFRNFSLSGATNRSWKAEMETLAEGISEEEAEDAGKVAAEN